MHAGIHAGLCLLAELEIDAGPIFAVHPAAAPTASPKLRLLARPLLGYPQ